MRQADVVIIGAGIVGLATAYRLAQAQAQAQAHAHAHAQTSCKIIVVDKESALAAHQTGHNSGVLHSGIYYKPGSLKAVNCRQGKKAMEQFCQEHGIAFDTCGKVIVAVDESELNPLQNIYQRGKANGVNCRLIEQAELLEREPHVTGLKAIHVPETGIVSYRQVCEKLAELLQARDHEVLLNRRVAAVHHHHDSTHPNIVTTSQGDIAAKLIVNCAGLHCDRVSAKIGIQPDSRIIPFRGEYYEIREQRKHLCRNLIYPVPDPKFPFLGVHFTRMIDGSVECGPNAVLAFAREGYRKRDINLRDLLGSLTYPGFVRMAAKHWRMGCGEMWRSFSRNAFVKALQRLIPEIQSADLNPAPAGVRAQAVLRNGQLVDDFLIEESQSVVSVLNAPSPAATSSLNIGSLVAKRLHDRLK